MNVKHILSFLSLCARTHAHTRSLLGFAKVHRIKQMRLERGLFNFEVSKTLSQMHWGAINSDVSPLRQLD